MNKLITPDITGPLMANSHPGSYSGQDAYNDMFAVLTYTGGGYMCHPRRKLLQRPRSKERKGKRIYRLRIEGGNRMPEKRYRVRRLTPTECARLQGFPDTWGHPEPKETMTPEEVEFWNEARRVRAAIDGKTAKPMTAEQLTKWYNSLRTDSSEYKMWGNGIALPNAAFVLGRVAEALRKKPSQT